MRALIQIITLNINALNTPIRRQADWMSTKIRSVGVPSTRLTPDLKTQIFYILASFVKHQLAIGVRVYFWAFYSFPLIHRSVFVPVPHCLDYCSKSERERQIQYDITYVWILKYLQSHRHWKWTCGSSLRGAVVNESD